LPISMAKIIILFSFLIEVAGQQIAFPSDTTRGFQPSPQRFAPGPHSRTVFGETICRPAREAAPDTQAGCRDAMSEGWASTTIDAASLRGKKSFLSLVVWRAQQAGVSGATSHHSPSILCQSVFYRILT